MPEQGVMLELKGYLNGMTRRCGVNRGVGTGQTWTGGARRGPCGLGWACMGRGMLCAPRSEQLFPMSEDPGEFCRDSRLICWLP